MVGPEGAGGAVYCWLCARSTPASDRNFNVHCDLLEVGREPRLMSRRIDTRAVIPERPNYLVGASWNVAGENFAQSNFSL